MGIFSSFKLGPAPAVQHFRGACKHDTCRAARRNRGHKYRSKALKAERKARGETRSEFDKRRYQELLVATP